MTKPSRVEPLARLAACLAACLLSVAGCAPGDGTEPGAGAISSAVTFKAQPNTRIWESWVGPNAFVSGRTVRGDFQNLYRQPAIWSGIRQQTETFKGYLMTLPADSGVDLNALAATLDNASLKVAFEVGGLRLYNGVLCNNQLGEGTAQFELSLLRRWKQANGGTGHVEYLTTDHAIAQLWASQYDPNVPPAQRCTLTLDQLATELVDYFAAVRLDFPNARLGLIESLGYWRITGPGGKVYRPTSHFLPETDLSAVLSLVVTKARARGITIDHFHLDYGMEGTEWDAVNGVRDYGRILGAETVAHSLGLRSGTIVNAFADKLCPNTGACDISARDRSALFLQGYLKTATQPDAMLFQQWQPNPTLLGTEADGTATSTLGLDNALLYHYATPTWLPVGEYRATGGLIFKVKSANTYCRWLSWVKYLAAHNGNGDVSGLAAYGSAPVQMSDVGECL